MAIESAPVAGFSEPPASMPDPVALRACWHPVGFAAALKDEPIAAMLLGEPVVMWRDSGGGVGLQGVDQRTRLPDRHQVVEHGVGSCDQRRTSSI